MKGGITEARGPEVGTSADAFDHIGARYDDEFTNTELSRWFRRRVWERLGVLFSPGDRVIELGCGTGEDAVWLAKRGVRVLATDGSPAMLAETARKAEAENVGSMVETRLLDLVDAAHWTLDEPGSFDGAYSNYGPLNCVGDRRAIGTQLARAIRHGGKVGLGVIGPWCPWEVCWHGIHGDLRTATRRLRGSTTAHLDGRYFQVYYPTPGRLLHDFGADFRRSLLWGLGVFLPPSDLYKPVGRRPWLAKPLLAMERLTAPYWPFKYLGDHFWLELERT
ncbi:MAG TPA: class I SAM-dependent methyltransferase [Aggregatilineales bacterium]|nr:class I SAM-dependent methyltransferase [Aggregatilineales bacterium]